MGPTSYMYSISVIAVLCMKAAAQIGFSQAPKIVSSTVIASFEGAGITSSKGVLAIVTGTPSVPPKREQFCYNGLLYDHLFPGEILNPTPTPALHLPTNVVPNSSPNLAVYNYLIDQPGNILNLEPATISIDPEKCATQDYGFTLTHMCYSCIVGGPEGAANPPLAGTLEITGFDKYRGNTGTERFPFVPNGDRMTCVDVDKESLQGVNKLELRCRALGLPVAFELDDVVFTKFKCLNCIDV